MRQISSIIIHCSDSWWGDAAEIDRWHVERGFDGIGYHYVILNGFPNALSRHQDRFDPGRNGEVQTGRDIAKAGAHCQGYNSDSIGICLIGKHHFTSKQLCALKELYLSLKARFGELKILAHCELNKGKTCPNISPDLLRGILN